MTFYLNYSLFSEKSFAKIKYGVWGVIVMPKDKNTIIEVTKKLYKARYGTFILKRFMG